MIDSPRIWMIMGAWEQKQEEDMSEKRYEEYLQACREIASQCEEEGYPSCGENYDLRVEQLQKESFPDLFEDEDENRGTYDWSDEN